MEEKYILIQNAIQLMRLLESEVLLDNQTQVRILLLRKDRKDRMLEQGIVIVFG